MTPTYTKDNTTTKNGVCAFWGVKHPNNVRIDDNVLDLRFLSNFYEAPFKAPIVTPGQSPDGYTLASWTSSEQYFMYRKAMFFCDLTIAEKLMEPNKNGNYYKTLGRKVGDTNERPSVVKFDTTLWSTASPNIMFDALVYKFATNAELSHKLRQTGDQLLVEASPYDKIWGAGADKSKLNNDPKEWTGQNLLGFLLMQVRDIIA